jgi:enoyl-CoA hydratase/carnithine racemase
MSSSPEVEYETITVRDEGAVLFAELLAPPMNLLGPELVRDLGSLIQHTEVDETAQVLVFRSGDPHYFISHVDVTRIKEYRAEAAKLTGEASIALLFRYLSASRFVTIAQIEGRVRAGGAAQHLTRLMGRARALEVMLSAEDYDADLAERYGWINRALPADELDEFVRALAHRIAGFPVSGQLAVKDRVNAIALAPVDDFRRDSDLFAELVVTPEAQSRIGAALKRGFQTPSAELDLAGLLGDLRHD